MLSSSEILPWNAARPRIIALVACDYNPRTSLKRASGEKQSKPQPVCVAFLPAAIFRQIRNRPSHAEVLNPPKTASPALTEIVDPLHISPPYPSFLPLLPSRSSPQ